MSNKEAIAKSPSGRVKRTPIGVRNVLTVNGKEAGYVYRIVNDDADRVQQFLDAGYEHVLDKDVTVGDKRVERSTADGTNAQVSVGGGKKAFVMRIKQEWYDEDQKAKSDSIADTESSMKQVSHEGTYGNISIERK